ncbi:hypothetical protein CFC21_051271 [Triticum aestivum]|uniref:Uncharacterized protein n=2 Tax=Triticum aestivum TaxID=4565 RepID=A0A9R1K5F7_WHEAT|nr:hypothetical protein CFC21_051271 [Triticum aestivum]
MEAEALMMGLKLAENWTSTPMRWRDSMKNIQGVKNQSEYRTLEAVVTYDCRNLMASFGRARMMHRGREADSHEHLVDFVLLTGLRGQGEPPSYFPVPVLVKDMIII